MELGMIGLGRMGANMVERLVRGGHRVVGYDPSAEAVRRVASVGAVGADSDGSVGRRLRAQDPGEVGLSAIAAHELYYGAYRSRRRENNLALVDALLFEVVEFDREDGRYAGEIRAALASAGTPLGPYDVLIAGQALARELTLVTANVAEFRRVAGLVLEDWSRRSSRTPRRR